MGKEKNCAKTKKNLYTYIFNYLTRSTTSFNKIIINDREKKFFTN